MKNKITEIENVILWKKKNKADKSLSRLINGERQLNSKIRDEKSVQLQVLERLKGLQQNITYNLYDTSETQRKQMISWKNKTFQI